LKTNAIWLFSLNFLKWIGASSLKLKL